MTVLGLGAAAVPAAPAEPTMSVAELQEILDSSPTGTVEGYFKTVLKGTTVTRIPVTVQAVVPNYIPEGALIMFAAAGPDIEQIGGIAQGMSGSPLFVPAHGVDKLVGAVSYGDSFTTGYLGLATPVQYMASMEDTFMPAGPVTSLPRAVTVAGRSVDEVIIAPSLSAARAARPAAGTSVMAPLATMSVAGLPPRSAVYKDVVKRLEAHGVTVAPAGAGLTGQAARSETPLDGGSALAVLFARGDMLYGAAGTVTWNNGGRVVAFGHPLLDIGDVEAYLLDAAVHGVWSSAMVPYKVVSPTSLRGTVLQDRGTGVAGKVGAAPQEVPVTASVTLLPQNVIARTTAFVPDWVVTSFPGGDGPYLAAAATATAGYNASDNAMMPGSATTTTTVVVEDDAGSRYTVARANTWDDSLRRARPAVVGRRRHAQHHSQRPGRRRPGHRGLGGHDRAGLTGAKLRAHRRRALPGRGEARSPRPLPGGAQPVRPDQPTAAQRLARRAGGGIGHRHGQRVPGLVRRRRARATPPSDRARRATGATRSPNAWPPSRPCPPTTSSWCSSSPTAWTRRRRARPREQATCRRARSTPRSRSPGRFVTGSLQRRTGQRHGHGDARERSRTAARARSAARSPRRRAPPAWTSTCSRTATAEPRKVATVPAQRRRRRRRHVHVPRHRAHDEHRRSRRTGRATPAPSAHRPARG